MNWGREFRETWLEAAAKFAAEGTPSSAELDSALARTTVVVSQWRGAEGIDVPSIPELEMPEMRALYCDHEHFHLAMAGAAAVQLFVAGAPDSVVMRWPGIGGKDTTATVPLERARAAP